MSSIIRTEIHRVTKVTIEAEQVNANGRQYCVNRITVHCTSHAGKPQDFDMTLFSDDDIRELPYVFSKKER